MRSIDGENERWARSAPCSCEETFVFGLCRLAVEVRAKDGSLPLHTTAASDAPLDVIYFLVRTWPKAVGL
jgi:hypothetical protein